MTKAIEENEINVPQIKKKRLRESGKNVTAV